VYVLKRNIERCVCHRHSASVLQSVRRRRRLYGYEGSDDKTIQVRSAPCVCSRPNLLVLYDDWGIALSWSVTTYWLSCSWLL